MTTDASVEEVISAFEDAGVCVNLRPDDESRSVFRFGTLGGAYVTSCWDLKPDIDEYETWIDVYEQSDPGSAVRLFEVLACALSEEVVLYDPRTDEVAALGLSGTVQWLVPRDEALRMGDDDSSSFDN